MQLSRLAEIRSGTAFKADAKGVPFVQARHMRGGVLDLSDAAKGTRPARSAAEAALKCDDVLVDTRGSVNWAASCQKLGREMFAILDLAIIRLSSESVLPEFLALYLNLPSTQALLNPGRSTASIPRLGLAAIGDLDIPVPSLEKQRLLIAIEDERRKQHRLTETIREARNRFTDEILRRVAEDLPMPDANPAWAIHRQTNLAQDDLAYSTPKNGDTIMSNKKSPGKGGTTHVVPDSDGGWNVKRGGASRASGHFDTKQEAVDRAREISRNAQSELKIHNQDGKIAQSDSHGNDPRSVKG